MSSSPLNQPATPLEWIRKNPLDAALIALTAGIFLFFYAGLNLYGNHREQSVLKWIWAVCGKKEYDYAHGRFIPAIMAFLVFFHWKDIQKAERGSDKMGLILMIAGIGFYIIAARTIQARFAAGSIPFIVYGFIAYVWGRQVARFFIFPLILTYFAIPLPGLTQATNGLQLIATKAAYHLSTLLGADIVVSGNEIDSATGAWGKERAFNIAEGCSGIRSLVALTLIAAVYGHVTQNRLWKKIALLACSVPIAIVANSLRVTTIVLIAESGNPDFAAKTYHDWSGFLFFPLALAGLLIVAVIINKGWRGLMPAPTQVTRITKGGKATGN